MENDTTAERQRKYKSTHKMKGLKRVGVIVPIEKADRLKLIAKRMRENFKTNKKDILND